MENIEKSLILGALFHDIGKFEQLCSGNPEKKKHSELGSFFINTRDIKEGLLHIVGDVGWNIINNIVREHHKSSMNEFTSIIKTADHLSASDKVEKEEEEEFINQWSHKYLCSLFTKINLLNNKNQVPPRYYKHLRLINAYDVIIPKLAKDDIQSEEYRYKESDFKNFSDDLKQVFTVYKEQDDFDSLINLLLIVFEKYLWCIPDFAGSSLTDVSLYNHLKDVAGFSHAIYLTEKENKGNKNLNLIIGDIPGIQGYIFDVVNKKPAKILRGRSIFVQILSRNCATIFLRQLGLTEANLIMLAGGKFYIIAPDIVSFSKSFQESKNKIEKYLFDYFRLELSFNCAYHTFDYNQIMQKQISFGEIIEDTSHKLIENRYRLFDKIFFDKNESSQSFIISEEYIQGDGTDNNSIKCKVTDKPLRKEFQAEIKIPDDKGMTTLTVSTQVKAEYEIGYKIVDNNVLIEWNIDDLSLYTDRIINLKDFNKETTNDKNIFKLLINPVLEDLLKSQNVDIYRNIQYLQVANYCSKDNNDIMPFDELSKCNDGADFLTLIKGDIDNLGLIMAYGLTGEINNGSLNETDKLYSDLTAVSRTTTLSNHIKYFFSFFLNGFMKEWEEKGNDIVKTNRDQAGRDEKESTVNRNRIYTIFAGGDDLMLIAPQSEALKFIYALNNKFNDFVCNNSEVHISYSVTHFKDHTPIRMVSDIAEKNQEEGKKYFISDLNHDKSLCSDFNKASTFIFNTPVKNYDLDYLLTLIQMLTEKAKDQKSGLSRGLIQKLLYLSEMMNKYEESGRKDGSYLIAYARMNYTVKRLLKNPDNEIQRFFDYVLTVNKEENIEAQKLEKLLYPLICQVIYNTRNKNGE